MHRLQQYLTSVLWPQIRVYESCSAEEDAAKKTMLGASIVESFLWLHLGTEIGAFPEAASSDIYDGYLGRFFQSLLSNDVEARAEMKMGRIYIAHSDQSKALLPMLGRFATVLLEKAMRQEKVFPSEQARFSRPDKLTPVFQTFLILQSRLIFRPSVESFTYQVSFADERTWRHSWNEDSSPEEVMLADAEDGSISSAICAGYLNLWNYGVKAMTVAQNLEDDRELSSDLFRFTDRLKEMQRWRIDLKSRNTSQRFDDVRVSIMEKLDAEAKDHLSQIYVKKIRESMNSAFNFWFSAAPIPVVQVA